MKTYLFYSAIAKVEDRKTKSCVQQVKMHLFIGVVDSRLVFVTVEEPNKGLVVAWPYVSSVVKQLGIST